jgi:rubrerythrin
MGKRKRKSGTIAELKTLEDMNDRIEPIASTSENRQLSENVNPSIITTQSKKKRKKSKKEKTFQNYNLVDASATNVTEPSEYELITNAKDNHQDPDIAINEQESSIGVPGASIPIDTPALKRKKRKAKKTKRKDSSDETHQHVSASENTLHSMTDGPMSTQYKRLNDEYTDGQHTGMDTNPTSALNSASNSPLQASPVAKKKKRKKKSKCKSTVEPDPSNLQGKDAVLGQNISKIGISERQIVSIGDCSLNSDVSKQDFIEPPAKQNLKQNGNRNEPDWKSMDNDTLRTHVHKVNIELPAEIYIRRLEYSFNSLKETANYLESKLQKLQGYADKNMKMITCEICLELFTNPHILECGHTYCYACIKSWSEKNETNGSCPSCRNPLTIRPKLNLGMEQIVHHLVEQMDNPKRDTQLQKLSKAKEGFKAIGDLWPNWKEVEREVIRDMDDGVER